MLERFFRLSENQISARTELLAGVTTFLTMAYIIFIQPAVLSGAMFLILSLAGLRAGGGAGGVFRVRPEPDAVAARMAQERACQRMERH